MLFQREPFQAGVVELGQELMRGQRAMVALGGERNHGGDLTWRGLVAIEIPGELCCGSPAVDVVQFAVLLVDELALQDRRGAGGSQRCEYLALMQLPGRAVDQRLPAARRYRRYRSLGGAGFRGMGIRGFFCLVRDSRIGLARRLGLPRTLAGGSRVVHEGTLDKPGHLKVSASPIRGTSPSTSPMLFRRLRRLPAL